MEDSLNTRNSYEKIKTDAFINKKSLNKSIDSLNNKISYKIGMDLILINSDD